MFEKLNANNEPQEQRLLGHWTFLVGHWTFPRICVTLRKEMNSL